MILLYLFPKKDLFFMSDNTTLPVRAVELLASRICHDLVSPVGAVANGVEFMRDMGADGMEDSIGLIEHSANQASVRLMLFRLCYGAGGSEKLVSAKAIWEAFTNFMDKSKYSLEWDLLNDVPDELPDGFFKMILNAMIFIHEGLPKGGSITVKNHGHLMTIEGTGDMIRLKAGSTEALTGQASIDDIDPKNIHGYVTHYFSRIFGIDMELEETDNNLTIRLFIPQN
jgi:histidine phosphotransferase ChpT